MQKNNLKFKIIFHIIIFCGIFGTVKNSWAANPVIYPVAATAGVTASHIVWSTDIEADSRVDYGTTTTYGNNVTDAASATWHHLTISGLTANTTYHYKITSGTTVSDDYTFMTYDNPIGTVRTVGSGKTYATIQDCANASSTGNICLVYAGIYTETVTPPTNGIIFLAQELAVVTAFNITSRTATQIKGFHIFNTTTDGVNGGSADYSLIENNYIQAEGGRGIKIYDNVPANNVIIRKNIIYHSGWVTGGDGASEGIYIFGDRNLIENNDISHGADFTFVGGSNIVVRNNIWHHASHEDIGGSEHIDGLQVSGGTFNYALVEGNIEYVCSDLTGNCHFSIIRNQTAPAADNIIYRYNYATNLNGSGVSFGGLNDDVPNGRFYNNTMATGSLLAENGDCVSFQNADNGIVLNNICYNTDEGGWYPIAGAVLENYNIAFASGYDGSWNAPYSDEATYDLLKNKDPLFLNYPVSHSIPSNSPAVDAGGALTTVAPGDSGSGTILVVSDSRFFQPGWAGTQADWIAVGTVSNTVMIQSIDYANNTITLANGVSRSDGQSVWLYKKSDGLQVLEGIAPDIGAYEYASGEGDVTAPGAPSGLAVE